MKPKKQWDVYVIHHSHTDIGYTERQDKIIRYHCDFIKQAVDILNDLHRNNRQEYQGFVWQCKNYWQVKNFYAHASREYIEDFEKYVRSGEIGLSGNYLNMTELISSDVLDTRLEQARQYGERIGHPVISAMTADVNGYAWGYADALYNHGIRHLYSCVHTHHGMFPLYKKTMPFYWEGPGGNRVLVWNGEHYHYGNELFLAPHGGTSYLTHDEFHRPCLEGDILRTSAGETEKEEMKIATCRIERFLENLEEEGYPYDLVPLMVSGVITDNAPPSAEIARRLKDLNVYYDGQIRFRMVTLEQFFAEVEKRCQDIPVYSGEWNDWWAEGVEDLLPFEGYRKDTGCVETDYYAVYFDQSRGISAILDKKDGKNLLMENDPYPAFSGIYEVTDSKGDVREIRGSMGRNRKSAATRRCAAALKDIQIKEKGDVYTGVQLEYNLEGTGFYSVFLKIYKDLPKMQATVRIHKTSVWDPENLYVSLPFTAGRNEVRYLDKTGCVIRPGIDQLPGTNMDFYLLQNGIVLEGEEKTVTVAVKDTPLVTFGSLEAKPIRLCSQNDWELNGSEMYSWVMNNFWETNFKVDLGGFYEFSYVIATQEKMDKEEAVKVCEAENEGILGFYTR